MDPFEQLLIGSSNNQVSPEILEMLGSKASKMYIEQGTSLNDAITNLISQHPELGNEHIKRIVEFANTQTFQHLFQNDKDKNVHFDVADPGVIIRDTNDGGSPAHSGSSDYHSSPDKQLEKNDSADVESGLDQLFMGENTDGPGGNDIEKNAETLDHALHANPLDDAHDLHQRLVSTRDYLAGGHERLDLMLKQAQEDLYLSIKQEVLGHDGAGLGGVIGALEKVGNPDYLAPVMEKIANRLLSECGHETTSSSLEKRAGAVVNPNHPLIQHWVAIEKIAKEKVRVEDALLEVDGYLNKLSSTMTSAIMTSIKRK